MTSGPEPVHSETAAPKRKPRSGTKGQRTRAKIKQAILRLLAEKHVSEIYLEDICGVTGLTVGGFYFHFRNKDAALQEVAVDGIRFFYQTLAEAPEQDDFFTELYNLIWNFVHSHVQWSHLARAVYAILRTDSAVYAEWRQARQMLARQLSLRFTSVRTAAGLSEEPVETLAHFVLNGVDGVCEELLSHATEPSVRSNEDARRFSRELAIACYSAVMERGAEQALVAGVHDRVRGRRKLDERDFFN